MALSCRENPLYLAKYLGVEPLMPDLVAWEIISLIEECPLMSYSDKVFSYSTKGELSYNLFELLSFVVLTFIMLLDCLTSKLSVGV